MDFVMAIAIKPR